MKIVLVAVIMAAVVPSLASAQFVPEDYPAFALRNHEEGRTAYLIQYGPDGRVTSCAVTKSSGYADLDVAACRLLKTRARFRPGRSGEKDGFVDWRIPRDPEPASSDQSRPTPTRTYYPSAQSSAAYATGRAQAAAATAAGDPR